jgi:hypothetical protein
MNASKIYQLVILASGQDDWAAEVEQAVRTDCMKILRHDSMLVRRETVQQAAEADAPTAVVLLGSHQAAITGEIAAAIEEARASTLPILPLIQPNGKVSDLLPASVARLNAVMWGEGNISLEVLRTLGLVERDRRLFLSYRRAESAALATQLQRALSERFFDVFLDRFSVPPGDDFQSRIDIELSDKAFVLLIESPGAVGSDWVQHEVAFALSHQIAVLAVSTPGVNTAEQFEVVDDAFRLVLRADDFDRPFDREARLVDDALARVVMEVEVRYAQQVRRRYVQLLGSTSDFLRDAGYERTPLTGWAIAAARGGRSQVFLVTANAPIARDLRHADSLREELATELGGGAVDGAVVVHRTPNTDADALALVDWIAHGRPLSIVDLSRLPERIA